MQSENDISLHETVKRSIANATEIDLPGGHSFLVEKSKMEFKLGRRPSGRYRRADVVLRGRLIRGPLSLKLHQTVDLIVEVGVWSLKDPSFDSDIANFNALAIEIDVLAKPKYGNVGLSARWIKTGLLERMVQVQCVDVECDLAWSAAWRDAATECICCHTPFEPRNPWHDYCKRCWRLECWMITGCKIGQRLTSNLP